MTEGVNRCDTNPGSLLRSYDTPKIIQRIDAAESPSGTSSISKHRVDQ
jgi:hypothetical protein